MLLTIDPQNLLRARFATSGQPETWLTVIVCRYVPIFTGAVPWVGVELLYDPQNAAPNAPYYVASEQLLPVLITPDALLEVRPYWPPATPLAAPPR
jgi:hypothetical protein